MKKFFILLAFTIMASSQDSGEVRVRRGNWE